MKLIGEAKTATTTSFITWWTSKYQILTYIYTLFLDYFCVFFMKVPR